MAQRNHLPRSRRRHRRTPAVLLCLLAGPLAQAATSVEVEIRGVDEELRNNVVAYLSFERYKKGGAELTPDVVERLHNRVEREVDAALRPFGYYEPQVQSSVNQENGVWHVTVNITPGPPVLIDHLDVSVDGPGGSDPLFQRILNHLPLHSGQRLNHKAYEDIQTDLQRTAATYGYLDARMIHHSWSWIRPRTRRTSPLSSTRACAIASATTSIKQAVVKESLVRRYLRYHEGDPFDLTQVLRTQFALDDSQYFANLEVLPGEPDRDHHTVPVSIRADASRRHRYSIGAGYATDTGPRGTLGFEDHRINESGHTFSVAVQAAQVTKYSLQTRYTIPIGDPAVESFSLRGSIEQRDWGDVTTITQSVGPAITAVTNGWQHVWTVNAVHTTSESIAGDETDTLLVPELDLASVPKGYLGEPLFEHPLFIEIKGSHSSLGSNSNWVQAHVQAERVFPIARKWHLLLRGEVGATLRLGIQRAADRVPLLRRRRQQCARLRLQRSVAAAAGVYHRAERPVPEESQRLLPGGGDLYQGRRQGRDHRHGGGDPRPAEKSRPRDLLRLRQRLRSLRHAPRLLGRHRPARAPAGAHPRRRHRAAAVRAVPAARHLRQLHAQQPAVAHQFLPEAVMRKPTLRQGVLVLASVLIVTLILGPLVLVWGALYTTSGAQFIVRHLPRQIGGVQLQISGLSGTVAQGLHVERVEIDQELVHLRFEDIDARVTLAPLLLQTIRATYASVGLATIEVKRRVHPPTPSPPLFLPSWLLISAEEAHVKRADLSVYNGFKLSVADINAAAVLRHKSIRLFQAEGLLEGAHVSAIGELLATDPLGLDVKGHLDWQPPGQPAYVLDGSAHGDLNRLQVMARIESPFRSDVNGQLLDLTNHFHWVANAIVYRFELSAWGVAGPLGSITGNLAGAGDANLFRAQGAVNPAGLRVGVFDVQFEGGWANHVLSAKRMQARHVDSGARASAAGTIAIVDGGPRLDLKGSWNEFRWPLIGRDVVVRSDAGTFALEGLMPYRVRLTRRCARAGSAGDARGPQRHARQGQLRLRARGG